MNTGRYEKDAAIAAPSGSTMVMGSGLTPPACAG